MKIFYNGIEQKQLDKRFSDEKWFWKSEHRSDPRINRRHNKGFKIKFKHIVIFLIFALIIWFGHKVDRGDYQVKSVSVAPVIQEVKAETPIIEPKTIEQQIRDKFGKDGDKAVKVAYCESRLEPNKINYNDGKYHSVGLFQINLVPERGLTIEQMKNPDENIDYAYMLFSKHGGFARDWVWCNAHIK